MNSGFSHVALQSDDAWQQLLNYISPEAREPASAILEYLRTAGAVSVIVEQGYLDRDYSEEYSAFYSKVFRRYKKTCTRLHFFSATVEKLDEGLSPRETADLIDELGGNHYLGFVVKRPLPHAPVGRTVLTGPTSPDGLSAHLLVRADYEVHLMGATLTVDGTPFTQQDTRVGACAQAAIWMAARHFHTKHRENWTSMVEVSDQASNPADTVLSQSLPAGSGGLSADNMIRSLRGLGRVPLIYAAQSGQEGHPNWTAPLDPSQIINRYVDSGIPVIVGLLPWANQNEGHAVTVVGHALTELPTGYQASQLATRSVFCEAFLVNDDQRGYALRMPLGAGSAVAETPYNVADHCCFILVALPNKVYMKAEVAEQISWSFVRQYPQIIEQLLEETQKERLDEREKFAASSKNGLLIARTYLTYGWKHKKRIIRSSANDLVKYLISETDFPRFVWVTEFGYFDELNYLDPSRRNILAHAVVDATSTQYIDNLIFAHVPGLVFRSGHNPDDETGAYTNLYNYVENDNRYEPRIRGVT